MFISKTLIKATRDFSTRDARNITQGLVAMISTPYITIKNTIVNAKSLVGLLSLSVKEGESFTISAKNSCSQKQSDDDLYTFKKILGDIFD